MCIITAPVLPNACLRVWYTKCVFTRLVRVYAFGVPTTRLRVWCTPEALTNQGEAHQYIGLVVCFNKTKKIKNNKYHINAKQISNKRVLKARKKITKCSLKKFSPHIYIYNSPHGL